MSVDVERIPLDAHNTRVTFSTALGPLAVHGRFTQLRGTLVIPGADIELAQVLVDVVADSIETGVAMRDRHLRGASFLDTARDPLISYRSQRVVREHGALWVDGLLSLRGIEREVQSRIPVAWTEREGVSGSLSLIGGIRIPRTPHGVGVARGLDILNPIFLALHEMVEVRVEMVIPASRFLPALLPALGR